MDLKEKLTSLKKPLPLLSDSETEADRISASEAVGYNQAISDVIELLDCDKIIYSFNFK